MDSHKHIPEPVKVGKNLNMPDIAISYFSNLYSSNISHSTLIMTVELEVCHQEDDYYRYHESHMFYTNQSYSYNDIYDIINKMDFIYYEDETHHCSKCDIPKFIALLKTHNIFPIKSDVTIKLDLPDYD